MTAQPTKTTDKQTPDAQGAPSLTKPIPVTNPPPDEKKYPAKQESPNRYSWLYDWLWLSIMPNWVTVAGSVAAICLAIRTLRVTNQSANAAKDAAEAAKRQGIIMAALDRPWLIMDKPEIINWPLIPPYHVHIDWSITNYGTSPAFLNRLSAKFGVEQYPLPEPPQYANPEPFGEKAIPQGQNQVGEAQKNVAVHAQDIKDGKACIVFYGFMDYRDALNQPHHTNFCCYWFYVKGGSKFSPTGPPSYMKYD